MKVFLILAIFSIAPVFAVTVNSQSIQLKGQELTVREAFREIERQSEYSFFYNADFSNLNAKVHLRELETDIHGAMGTILESTNLTYRIIDDNLIVITPGQMQEEITIRGQVRAATGETLPGVSVYIKGTTIGTITDVEGRYRLRIPDENVILVFSFVGMIPLEIQVGDQRWINVELAFDVAMLEVVVVTGYQTLSHERVTGSFERIPAEELERTITFSIEDKLEGLVSGVLMDPLGIAIRGISTLHASRIPLVIVDGFPLQVSIPTLTYSDEAEFEALSAALKSINPDDIENITVMKDAAATSIWGSRAANGVIVITTKTGITSEPEITFNSSISFNPKPDVGLLPFASPQTLLEIERSRYEAGYFDSRMSFGPRFFWNACDYLYTLLDVQQEIAGAEYQLGLLEAQMGTYDNRYEFSDLFLRSNTRLQNNFSISQRVQLFEYRLSFRHDIWNKSSIGDDENRSNVSLLTRYYPKDWISLNFNANISMINAKNNGVRITELFEIPQYLRILDADGNYTSMTTNQTGMKPRPAREKIVAENEWFPYDWEWNIKREFDNRDFSVDNTDLRLQAEVQLKPIGDILTLSMQYQFERYFSDRQDMYNEETYYVRDQVNLFAQPDFLPIPKGNIFEQFYNSRKAHNIRFMTTFRKLFSDDHLVTALAGMDATDQFSDRSNNRRYGFDTQTQAWETAMDFANRYPRNLQMGNSPWNLDTRRAWSARDAYISRIDRFLSYFGNASYTYREKYDITGSIRLDRSNTFGQSPQYRDVPLWSAGVGWTIDREDFFNVDFVDRLRIRATYGFSGNIDKRTSPYPVAAVGATYNNPTLGTVGALVRNPANPELRWEKTEQINIAVDFSILNRLISGSIDVYEKRSSDLLGTMVINSTYGFSRALINFGSMINRGIDINLSMRKRFRQVMWTSAIRHSYNLNEITQIDPVDFSIAHLATVLSSPASRMVEGRPRFNLVSMPYGGLDNEGIPQFYWGEDSSLQNSLTAWPTYMTTGYDFFPYLEYNGAMQAPHYGSWTNAISYKGFELSTLLIYKFGHYYLSEGPLTVPNNNWPGIYQGMPIPHYAKDWENRWRNPGDENHTDIPRIPFELSRVQAGRIPYYSLVPNYGSHMIEPAANIRISRISLSYTLPAEWLTSVGIKSFAISLQGRNLGVINFNKFNEDPENLPDMFGRFIMRALPEYTIGFRVIL